MLRRNPTALSSRETTTNYPKVPFPTDQALSTDISDTEETPFEVDANLS